MSVITTERLTLRQFVPEDVENLYPILSDAETMRFYPAPFSREKTEDWIRWSSQHYDKGFGLWAVERRSDGLFLGDCGIVLQPIDTGEVYEVGYHIRRDCWGQGYAPEAARAARDYAFEHLDAPIVVSIVDPLNGQSRRVGEKIHAAMREFEWVKVKKTMCLYYTERALWQPMQGAQRPD